MVDELRRRLAKRNAHANDVAKCKAHVITVDNSPGALEIFQKTPSRFHLAICDMTMPQMTGIQLAGELLKLRPNLPIILCTGFSEFIDSKKAKAVGIKEFLMKPFSKRVLAVTIRRALDGK